MHIAMHAFGKITLFFCAGAIYVAAHKTEISDMRGHRPAHAGHTFAFFIGSLSVIGLPPMGGSWSKWFLSLGAADARADGHDRRADGQLAAQHRLPDAGRGAGLLLPRHRGERRGEREDGIQEAPLLCVAAARC